MELKANLKPLHGSGASDVRDTELTSCGSHRGGREAGQPRSLALVAGSTALVQPEAGSTALVRDCPGSPCAAKTAGKKGRGKGKPQAKKKNKRGTRSAKATARRETRGQAKRLAAAEVLCC